MITKVQVSKAQCKQLVIATAPAGNLFLLLLLPELRRQGLTFVAFYALQRIVKRSGVSEYDLRRETGLEGYEISRACKSLARNRLVMTAPGEHDRRVRLFRATSFGKRTHDRVLAAAASRLKDGLSLDDGFYCVGENRRLEESTAAYRKGNQILLGPLQLLFSDTSPVEIDV